ncbi:CNH domain-containing protein [Lipomyces oligophaga]|uniref:CNH domain-containing protein n=1 Tax=Lipomyces oligophaga TaxID=45792 RepID=UPI0034CEB0B3
MVELTDPGVASPEYFHPFPSRPLNDSHKQQQHQQPLQQHVEPQRLAHQYSQGRLQPQSATSYSTQPSHQQYSAFSVQSQQNQSHHTPQQQQQRYSTAQSLPPSLNVQVRKASRSSIRDEAHQQHNQQIAQQLAQQQARQALVPRPVHHNPNNVTSRSVSTASTPSTNISSTPRTPVAPAPTLPVSSYSFLHHDAPSHSTIVTASRGRPLVYPALLSAVAGVFVSLIQPGDRIKDSLTYKNSFTGAEAVDLLTYILQTPDRTLALLLGRALDTLKLFHDVTYVHKLRDHQDEVYQLRDAPEVPECGPSPSSGIVELEDDEDFEETDSTPTSFYPDQTQQVALQSPTEADSAETAQKEAIKRITSGVNGIFMLMTECYSPTCTKNQICYAVHCPKRLEQQFRAKEHHPSSSSSSHGTTLSSMTQDSVQTLATSGTIRRRESNISISSEDEKSDSKLWSLNVPKEVLDSVDEREKKRQEVISEVIYTERDFVKDLEYVRDFWIIPLRRSNIIPDHRREKFVRTVFSNIMEVHSVNSRLADALTKRQQQAPIVRQIGDILLEHVPRFQPFIKYGANQLYGKHEFEREKSTNPLFAQFVAETERKKESRKLELNGYLTKPTTRLARYPLLLNAVLKHTPEDSVDTQDLQKAVDMIKDLLSKLNVETGKASNRYELMLLSQSLVVQHGETFDLKLTEEGRRILFHQDSMKRRLQDQQGDITIYLLDHCLFFVKKKVVNRREQLKVFRKPIPLELLVLSLSEESLTKRSSSSILPGSSRSTPLRADSSAGNKYPLTFTHLGRRGYDLTLYAPNYFSRKTWADLIAEQQTVLRDRSKIFEKTILCSNYFRDSNRVKCAVPFDGGRKMLYGTDLGIYMSYTRPNRGASRILKPQRLILIPNVTQLDVLEEYSMLLVLADKTLYYWSLDALDTELSGAYNGNSANGQTSTALAARKPKKVATHINFFQSGLSLGHVLVCTVKTNGMTATIKALEPEQPQARSKKQATFRRFLQGQSEGLKSFKEFYIPSEAFSLSFLKSKVCVGCAKGFELVSLETLDTQSLLDPADTSLDFAMHREGLKPIAIYRLNGDFLLNYSDLSFFVNRNGWRSRSDWIINWEGLPQSFALSYPYILAFEPSFIEIRHVESGALVHIITGTNIRFLHESTNEILYVYEDDDGNDVVAWLDFWGSAKERPSENGDEHKDVLTGNGVQSPGAQRLED